MRDEYNRAAARAKELRRIADIAEERAQHLIELTDRAFFDFRTYGQSSPEEYNQLRSKYMKIACESQEASFEVNNTNDAAREAELEAARLHRKLIDEIRLRECI